VPDAGEPTSTLDPRPLIEWEPGRGWVVRGVRCTACAHPLAYRRPACPVCGGRVEAALFGPTGTVWSHTRVHIAVGDRVPPYDVVYVDLDDGPRILAHATNPAGAAELVIGATVELRGRTPAGDPAVAVTE
jgi:uncharacterized OB-fold protein